MLCPSNTFMATPLAIQHAGGKVAFVDCNRDDLCMSFEDFERKAEQHKPKAAIVVHIGGHIAFEIERIADYCRANDIFLIEDCAHAHGADWNGKRPGSWGDAGVYSFYATKTVSTGEGGMLVSRHQELLEFARAFRNYGKPDHEVSGLNFRHQRVHRRDRPGPDRAPRGARREQEPHRARAPRPGLPRSPRATRRDDLGPLQVHRLRGDRALDRTRIRRSLPPPDGDRRRSAEHRLGLAEPLVRSPLLRDAGRPPISKHEQPASRWPRQWRHLDRVPEHRSSSPAARASSARTWSTSFATPATRRGSTTSIPSPHHAEGEIETVIGDLHDTPALVAAMEGCSAVDPPRRGGRRRHRRREPCRLRGRQRPRHPVAFSRPPERRSFRASSTARRSGSTASRARA